MNFRRSLLVGTSALALNAALTGTAVIVLPEPAQAACQSVSSDTTIGNSSTDCITWNSSNISITSAGTITGSLTGIFNPGNMVGSLTNTGSVTGSHYAIVNGTTYGGVVSTITAITNSGVLTGGNSGVINSSTIGAITNSGAISGGSYAGIWNNYTGASSIGTIVNNSGGTISSGGSNGGIVNAGRIGSIINAGTISGGAYGIYNYYVGASSIGTITNSGIISGGTTGIYNYAGTIGTITNSGTISGGSIAIDNYLGRIGGILSTGSIAGVVFNAGVISGDISVNQNLTIVGSVTGISSFGTLTGAGGSVGTITATGLTFGTSGGQLLNDDMNVGSGIVTNSGIVKIGAASVLTITGNYASSSGILVFGVTDATHYGDLVISSNANLSSSGISISGATIAGESFTIVKDAGTATYTGVTATIRGFTSSVSSISSSGFEDLIVTAASTSCAVVSGSDGSFGNASCILWNDHNLSIASNGTISGSNTGIIHSAGTAGTLTNSGSINGAVTGVYNSGSIASIVNGGHVTGGSATGIFNDGGSITAITNNNGSTISGGVTGIVNSGSIGGITNSGVITGGKIGIDNYPGSTISAIINSSGGTITGVGTTGILNYGSIGTINNSGSITSGHYYAIDNYLGGTIGSIVNSGVIDKDIINYGSIGIITNSIGGTLSGETAIYNYGGTIGTITNSGLISDYYGLYLAYGSVGTVNNSGIIASTGYGLYNYYNSISTIINTGTISGAYYGILSYGVIETINNSGTISGGSYGLYNDTGRIGTITNNGTFSGAYSAILNAGGSIATITNSGTLSGGEAGIDNYFYVGTIGTIGVISNSGFVGGGDSGIWNGGSSIGTITNTGTISGGSNGIANIFYSSAVSSIGTIANGGTINGGTYGVDNYGSIGVITNSIGGTISGGVTGLYSSSIGTIGTITNAGLISGVSIGLNNFGSIRTITNSGVLGGGLTGLWNGAPGIGVIDSIVNSGTISSSIAGAPSNAAISNQGGTVGAFSNSGLITGPIAIYSGSSGGTLGTILSAITNTGTISGNINVAQNLTFTGGNASTIGTLTGYNGGTGTIVANNLIFDSAAYQLLDDNVNVGSGSGTVTNSGVMKVDATHSITGNYVQGSGALLVIGVTDPTHYGDLVISGNATMTNGHVSIGGSLVNGGSFTIVQDAGVADYSGITASGSGFLTSISSISNSGYEDLIISLTSPDYGSIGAAAGGGTAPAIGAALNTIALSGNPAFTSILTALNNLGTQSPAAEAAGIKQLGPNPVTGQLAATGMLANQTMNLIGQHQGDLLAAAEDPNEKLAAGQAAGDGYRTGVFWGQAGGGFANRSSTADAAGYRQSMYGLAFGADDHIDKNTTAGLAFSWVASGARGSDDLSGNTTGVNSLQLTGYGTRRYGPGFVNVMAGLGYNMFTERRNITFLGETAKASYGGMQYMARIDGGWDFHMDNHITLTPLMGLQAVRADSNGYTEEGAGAADANVARQITNTFTTTLGGKVMTTLPTSWGLFTPEFKLLWAHDLTHGALSTTASLGGVSFATSTPRAAQDGAQVTLAATLATIPGQNDELSLRAEYDGDLRIGYQSHTGVLKFSWEF